jgi:hypothetical protein
VTLFECCLFFFIHCAEFQLPAQLLFYNFLPLPRPLILRLTLPLYQSARDIRKRILAPKKNPQTPPPQKQLKSNIKIKSKMGVQNSPLPGARPFDSAILRGVEQTTPEERTTHAAQCHCGAVKYSVTLMWPFPRYTVNRCTCSICTQNGYLLVYPARQDVVFSEGELSVTRFRFAISTSSLSCGAKRSFSLSAPASPLLTASLNRTDQEANTE